MDSQRNPASILPDLTGDPRENWLRAQAFLRRDGTGLAASTALHVLLALLVLWFLSHPVAIRATVTRVLPVDLVHLGSETERPDSTNISTAPKQASPRRGESSSVAPAGTSRDETKLLPQDAFDAKLRALSRLRQPDAKFQPLESTGADDSTAGGAAGARASYSLRDFVRAQVLRHWNLDYSLLGDRRFSIPIRVQMTSRGVITDSEIVEKARYQADAIYREIAISARNAVTLSSPIPLPPGTYADVTTFVLDLNPRDTNR